MWSIDHKLLLNLDSQHLLTDSYLYLLIANFRSQKVFEIGKLSVVYLFPDEVVLWLGDDKRYLLMVICGGGGKSECTALMARGVTLLIMMLQQDFPLVVSYWHKIDLCAQVWSWSCDKQNSRLYCHCRSVCPNSIAGSERWCTAEMPQPRSQGRIRNRHSASVEIWIAMGLCCTECSARNVTD